MAKNNRTQRPKNATKQGNLIVFALFTLIVSLSPALSADALHILLTNDDGIDAPGIKALETKLKQTGYRLSVVAPETQQSATSMKVSTKTIGYEQLSESKWAIKGSPADAVAIGLNVFLADDPPDLIVSGANFGQNLGSNTNLSGTVGAALMGMQLGVPGIAVSVGMHLSEKDMAPERFPSTMASFPAAADFTIELIRALEKSRSADTPLLPRHSILNVNYPALKAKDVKGPRLARISRFGGFIGSYAPTENKNELKLVLNHEERVDHGLANADTVLFNNGYITISVLTGELGASRHAYDVLGTRLSDLVQP